MLAHAGNGAAELVPLPLLLLGAAGAVVGVATLLGARTRHPAAATPQTSVPLPLAAAADHHVTRLGLQLVGLVAAVAVVAVAVGGPQGWANPAPSLVLSDLWMWLAVASLLLGPVWRLVNPLRPVTAVLTRLAGDSREEATRPLPEGLGWWPAAGGLFAFAWVALVLPGQPLAVVVLLAVHALVQLGAVSIYGTRWLDRGDPFEAYSRILGLAAPLRRTPRAGFGLASPRGRLAALPAVPGTAAVAGALIGWDLVDAVVETGAWHALGLAGTTGMLARTGALLGGTAIVGVLASMVTRRGLCPALLPLVAGWSAGHHLAPLAPAAGLAAFVAGHLGAVVVGHDRAVTRYGVGAAGPAQLEFRALVLGLLLAGLALRFG